MALGVYATLGTVLSIGLILGAALVPRVTNTPLPRTSVPAKAGAGIHLEGGPLALGVYATLGTVLSIGLILGAALVPRVTNTPAGKEVRNARR